MRAAFAVAALLALVAPVHAHPVPSDNHDRTVVVRLSADAVEVDYRLEMDETRAALDLPREDGSAVNSRRQFHEAVFRFYRSTLAENLAARLDGKPLDFTCVGGGFEMTDHFRCDYRFRATWSPAPGTRHAFAFRDDNFPGDDFSALRLSLGAGGQIRLPESVAPDEALMARPGSERKPGDGERLRKLTATFEVAAEEPRGAYKPALPPDPDPSRRGPRRTPAAGALTAPAGAVAVDKPAAPAESAEGDAPPQSLLEVMLDTRRGFALLLLISAGLGAAHALTPGHGKTVAAAYLVGERGTVWHALGLGLVTTLTHTSVVLVLAALLPVFFPATPRASVQSALGLFGGLLIAGLGLWLLMVRLAGRADHVHLGGGHHHHHHGDPAHDVPDGQPGWRGIVLLGISGGIVPCWDALAILGGTIAARKMWLALPALLAFSAGLASVLVVVGVAVVQARKWAGSRWGTSARLRGLERALPLVSAVVVTAMGLWLCFDSVNAAGHEDLPAATPSAVAPAEADR